MDKVMTFQVGVKAGAHYERGLQYKPGEYVKSTTDLVQLCKAKFARVHDENKDSHWPSDVPFSEPDDRRIAWVVPNKKKPHLFDIIQDGHPVKTKKTLKEACSICRGYNMNAKMDAVSDEQESNVPKTEVETEDTEVVGKVDKKKKKKNKKVEEEE